VNSATTPTTRSDSQNFGVQVFLIDDYLPALWELVKLIQNSHPRVRLVGTASTRNAALTGVIRQQPDVILLDHGLSREGTLDFLSQLAVLGHHRILMLIEPQYSPDLGRRAVALGACGVISKEAPAELLLHAIECAHRQGHLAELFTQTNPVNERRHPLRHSHH
jgi:two-component system, NarL family, nitrate/nitrite response regulator NarL